MLIADEAFVTWRPKTSAGAKIYLAVPSRSQLIIATDSLTPPPPCRFWASVQSRAAN